MKKIKNPEDWTRCEIIRVDYDLMLEISDRKRIYLTDAFRQLLIYSKKQRVRVKELEEALQPFAYMAARNVKLHQPDLDGCELVMSCREMRRAQAACPLVTANDLKKSSVFREGYLDVQAGEEFAPF